jgi:hypothetical protein
LPGINVIYEKLLKVRRKYLALRLDKKWILNKTQYGEMNTVGCCEACDLKNLIS